MLPPENLMNRRFCKCAYRLTCSRLAASCEQYELEKCGGNAGKALFDKARQTPHEAKSPYYLERRKVTLSTELLRDVVQDEDDDLTA
jgi:hypothetical protein